MNIEDIDNDAANELIVGTRQGDRGREVYVINVSGTFTSGFVSWNVEYNLTGLSGGAMYSVTTGDLDGDGNKEIHAFLWDLFTLRFIESTGPNTYSLENELIEVFPELDYGALDAVGVADADNDGTSEMYIATMSSPNQVFIITDITDVSAIDSADIQKLYKLPGIGTSGLRTMQITDADDDGNIDLMIAGERNGRVYDLEYSGTGDPTDSTSWDLTIAFDVFEVVAADLGISVDSAQSLISPRFFYGHPAEDMDGDGENEYVVVNYGADFANWANEQCVWLIEAGNVTRIPINSIGLPEKLVLNQNYPNPFNPETKFSYSLQNAGDVSIIVYDLLGQKVRTLVNDYKNAGSYTTQWDGLTDAGANAASGVYIYKLTTKDKQISKKMNLIR